MSSYLVTGGVGMVGSHLVELLIKNGHKVSIIDKLIYPDQSQLVLTDLKNKYPQLAFYNIDLIDFHRVENFFVNNSVDGVFHLAALPSHRISLSYPYEYFQNDLQATVNLLEVIKKICPKVPVVFSSTNKIYSDLENIVSEDSKSDPKGPYAIAKLQSEQWCKFYCSKFGLKVIVARLFHVVGARMQPNREIPIFVKAALSGETLNVHGRFDNSGKFESAYFGYTSVYDTISGLYLLMNLSSTISEFSIYNIGSDLKITVLDVLDYVMSATNCKSQIITTPLMEHESIGCIANSNKIKQLGWVRKHDVFESIREYILWQSSLKKIV